MHSSWHARAKEELAELQQKLYELHPERQPWCEVIEELTDKAHSFRKALVTGSAAFYRRVCPRSADQWVQEVWVRDWSDPSHPKATGGGNAGGEQAHAPNVTDHDDKAVADRLADYFRGLFSHKPNDKAAVRRARAALRSGKKVLPPTAHQCGLPITKDEVIAQINKLPSGKSPGPDRLPNAFYIATAGLIAPLLASFYNAAHAHGALPEDCKKGMITLLYKKNDRCDPRNYRPITLLNGDYKLMMRVLTERFNKAVLEFASTEQNGFVPEGFIVENIWLLQALQALAEEGDQEAMFIFLDFEKAFDRCSWEFLHDALDDLGFHRDEDNGLAHPFTRFVELAYSHKAPPLRQVYANGYLSDPFTIPSGVAQGCPLSPLLFVCFTEVLTRLINNDERIEGICHSFKGKTIQHLITQYADDSTLFATLNDIPHFQQHLQTYCDATNAKENEGKREAVLVGTLAQDPGRAKGAGVVNPFRCKVAVAPPRTFAPYISAARDSTHEPRPGTITPHYPQ